jgi:hypothetical protein
MMLISMSKVKYFHVAIFSSPSLLDERTETSKRSVVTRGEAVRVTQEKLAIHLTLIEVDKKKLDPKPSSALVRFSTKWVVAEEFTTQSLEESRKEYGESFGLIGRPRKAGTLFSFYSQ